MSQTTQVWQLIALLIIVWLLGGIGLAMVNILAGMFAGENERGKIFGFCLIYQSKISSQFKDRGLFSIRELVKPATASRRAQ